MSTWTSRGALLALLLAAGCAAPVDVARLAPERVRLAEGIVVAGPPGYCIDPRAVRETGAAAFVLLGSCAALSDGGIAAEPLAPGVLTVLVSPAGGGAAFSASSAAQLRRFFESEAGRASLSAEGRAETVEVLETRAEGGLMFVRARDTSRGRPAGVADDYWRAIFDLNGRLVTATVIGLETRPLASDDGLRTLAELTSRLVRENPPGLPE